MNESLGTWQEHLEKHFAELRLKRPSRYSVFALEHDLSCAQLVSLQNSIREHCKKNSPCMEHFACWVVYSAELGYSYEGDQYWRSFEETTPGWKEKANRDWLRTCYRHFAEQFGGATPHGAWAEQFGIISWPITHAILPVDLQRHLAETLYRAKGSLTDEILEEPLSLGRVIEAHSWSSSDRFRNLAEQHRLVGQIAAALLAESTESDDCIIAPATLARVTEDLEKEWQAREWLHEARRFARQARLRGLRKNPLAPGGPQSESTHVPDLSKTVGLRPRLFLVPLEDGPWRVCLEIPDLTLLLAKHPDYREILARSRCMIEGMPERSKPGGWLLKGMQRVVLHTWPRVGAPLITFGTPATSLSFLFAAKHVLGSGPTHVFRICADGAAISQRSPYLVEGNRYVVIMGEDTDCEFELPGEQVELDCVGAVGALVDLAEGASGRLSEKIAAVGLKMGVSLGAYPIGLPPMFSDGHGVIEWLADEPLRLAVESDVNAHDLEILLDDDNPFQTMCDPTASERTPTFVELPLLLPGSHLLRVRSLGHSGGLIAEGVLEILVRERLTVTRGSLSRGALKLELDPAVPTLDELWSNRINLTLEGPEGGRVKCHLSLHNKLGAAPLAYLEAPSLVLPVSSDQWRQYVDQHLLREREIQECGPLAKFAVINLDAADLGRSRIVCEREFTPIRWIIRGTAETCELELLNDTGSSTTADILEYTFDAPADPNRQYSHIDDSSLNPNAKGGMYVAVVGEFSKGIIVPPLGHSFRDFGELALRPSFANSERTQEEVCRLLRVYWHWATATIPSGYVTLVRRWQALRWLLHRICFVLCGASWGEQERRHLEGEIRATSPDLVALLSKRGDNSGFAYRLQQVVPELAQVGAGSRASTLAPLFGGRLGAALSVEDAELALRLVSAPESLLMHKRSSLRGLVSGLFERAVIVRAARLTVLLLDEHLGGARVGIDPLHLGWDW